MSLAEDLDDFFANSEEVIVTLPINFKEKLGIGDQVYGLLRAREKMTTFSEAIGIGATASSIAASSAVASTFFASSGIMASTLSAIGLGAVAVTPIGWVIAAGVISGGAYLGVSNLFEKQKDTGLIVVPKYINTPLDVIAVALIELMLPVSLKIAHAGGEMQESERKAIQDFFSGEWGYNPGFVSRLIEEYRCQIGAVSYSRLATSLGKYCAESKDCDKKAIMTSFVDHLREVVEADGVIHEQEKAQLDYLTNLLINESKKTGGSSAVTDALKAASRGLSWASEVASSTYSTAGKGTVKNLSTGSKYVTGAGQVVGEKSSKLVKDISKSKQVETIATNSVEIAKRSGELASRALKSGKKVAAGSKKSIRKNSDLLWKSISKKGNQESETEDH